jgi:hypothetical protein
MSAKKYETDLLDVVKWPLNVFDAVRGVTKGAKITTLLPSAAAVGFFVWYGGGLAGLKDIANKEYMDIGIQYLGAGAIYVGVCMVTKSTIDSEVYVGQRMSGPQYGL